MRSQYGPSVRYAHAAGKRMELQAQRQRRDEAAQDVKRYLADYEPEVLDRLESCSPAAWLRQDIDAGDRFKWAAAYCHQHPWCIHCAGIRTFTRTASAMEKFERCTPTGQEPRFIHVVQTAPRIGTGAYGLPAARRHRDFLHMVAGVTKDMLGDVGIVASYHDFGEAGPSEIHPHVDFTINGWRLEKGKAKQVPELFRNRAWHRDWKRATDARAVAFDVQAPEQSLNVWAGRPVTGRRMYWKVLAYQMRELWDMRKFQYDGKFVHWVSYSGNPGRSMKVAEFQAALEGYRYRIGWGKGSTSTHATFGHLANNRLRRTQRAMGGRKPHHRKDCACRDCGNWIDTYFDGSVAKGGYEAWWRTLTTASEGRTPDCRASLE